MLRTTKLRRRKEAKTNYHKRLNLLKTSLPRFVVRKSNKYINVQLISYSHDGDKVFFTLSSKSLSKKGWKHSCNNTPAAYLTGLMAGKKALSMKHSEAILDIGLITPMHGFKVYAVLKGLVDAGVAINNNSEIFPDEKRIAGEHINSNPKVKEDFQKYADMIKNGKEEN